ncbi:dihydrofolate reductase [Atheta coriaria]|uniref:dihydrofolate reductase n=1 Tax=Dalotia coriaria TaxID=877792 RepID=UPI0031F3EA75
MSVKLNLIAAACENMGIGKNNDLPWKLKKEMQYFSRMTTQTSDPNKKNVVIMGRKTWDSVPAKFKPFKDRINFILSRQNLDLKDYENVQAFKSLDDIITHLEETSAKEGYDKVWVIGGSDIYKLSLESRSFHRLYLTEIKKNFDCDTFFPHFGDNLKLVDDPEVPAGVQKEGDIEYVFKVYENADFGQDGGR